MVNPTQCFNQSNPTQNSSRDRKGIKQGIIYGIIPHLFCILFLVFTIIGSTIGATVVKTFLMIPNFFLISVVISIIFATVSAFLYLRNSRCCSTTNTIKKHWKYLSILYGTTLLVNLLFMYQIFPNLVMATNNQSVSKKEMSQNLKTMTIKVDLPCTGHAALMIDEIKKISNVQSVQYFPENEFQISYNPAITTPDKITDADIFKTYKIIK